MHRGIFNKLFLYFILLFPGKVVYSQVEISGYIQESGSGERLPYSNIYLDALQLGSSANENGFFSFKGDVKSYQILLRL